MRVARLRPAAACAFFALAGWLCGAAAVAAPDAAAPGAASAYRSIAIERPARGAMVFDNAGDMDVVVAVSPELHTAAGDRIALILDGRTASMRGATRFRLTGVVRGEHSVEAQLMDSSGNALIASSPVTFHMWQASRLFPKRRVH